MLQLKSLKIQDDLKTAHIVSFAFEGREPEFNTVDEMERFDEVLKKLDIPVKQPCEDSESSQGLYFCR